MNRSTTGFARTIIGAIVVGVLGLAPASAALAAPSMPTTSHSEVQILAGRGGGSGKGPSSPSGGRNVSPPRNSGGNSSGNRSTNSTSTSGSSKSNSGRNVQAPRNSGGNSGKSGSSSVKVPTVKKGTGNAKATKINVGSANTRAGSSYSVGGTKYTPRSTHVYYTTYHGGYPAPGVGPYFLMINDPYYYANYSCVCSPWYNHPHPSGMVLRGNEFVSTGHSAGYYLLWTVIWIAIIAAVLVAVMTAVRFKRRNQRYGGDI